MVNQDQVKGSACGRQVPETIVNKLPMHNPTGQEGTDRHRLAITNIRNISAAGDERGGQEEAVV